MNVGHITIHAIWAPAPYLHIDKGMITQLWVSIYSHWTATVSIIQDGTGTVELPVDAVRFADQKGTSPSCFQDMQLLY